MVSGRQKVAAQFAWISVSNISIYFKNIVRSKPPDFSLQVYSSRSRPRQLQLPWSTSEEKPEIRELRSPGCPTETA